MEISELAQSMGQLQSQVEEKDSDEEDSEEEEKESAGIPMNSTLITVQLDLNQISELIQQQ